MAFVLGNDILLTLGFGLLAFRDNILGCNEKLGVSQLNVTRHMKPN